MLKLERYGIEPSSDQIVITVNQKKNALVNIAFALVASSFATYQIATSTDVSSFYYVIFVGGILWFLIAIYAYRSKRDYIMNSQKVVFNSSNRKKPNNLLVDNISSIRLHKIIRPSGKKKRKVPFRWRVKLIDTNGGVFKEEFKFQKERNAKKLASLISEFYGVEVTRTEA